MPATIALGWLKFGVGVAALVLILALLFPRPGVGQTWVNLGYHLDHQLRRASAYALSFNPHGTGAGQPGQKPDPAAAPPASSAAPPTDHQTPPTPGDSPEKIAGGKPDGQDAKPGNPPPSGLDSSPPAAPDAVPEAVTRLTAWIKALVLITLAVVILVWIYRQRHVLWLMIQSLIAALRQFLQNLRGLASRTTHPILPSEAILAKLQPFGAFKNPFVTGRDRQLTPEQLMAYSYDALRSWACERGVEPAPEQTAREFCNQMGIQFPEVSKEMQQLAFLYGHAAYATAMPAAYDLEPIKRLWRFIMPPKV